MEERAIHISSINREKRGTSRPGDFTIKFNPSLKLDPDKKHQLALDRLSMTYSWYNIRSDYKNNKIKYTPDGSAWQTITFTDGMYSYSDINDYIHQYMDQKSHHTTDSKGTKKYSINLTFILSTYRVLVSLDGDYQLDLRGTEFGDLIGFEKKLITKTEYGSKLPNITNSIDVLNINTTAITDSIVNGINTNTIAVIPTDNLTRSYPFTFKKGAKKAVTSAATKTGEHVGKKAGDKIVQMLSKGRDAPKNPPAKKVKTTPNKTMTQKEIDQMLNNLLSGGSTRKIKGNLRFP